MQTTDLDVIARLTDRQLVIRLKALAGDERRTAAQLIAHLAVLDTRDVHLREGFSSLFAYCLEVLHLSEAEAYNRIEVARAARRFPAILPLLETGAVNVTTIRVLAPHLTSDNHIALLAEARGKRRVDVETIVARLAPKPDPEPLLRRLPAPSTRTGPSPSRPADPPLPPLPPAAPLPPLPPLPPPPPAPLSPDRFRLQLTVSGATVDKLKQVRDLLRHALPSGDAAAIFDRALDVLLAQLMREKAARAERPRKARRLKPGSRAIPAEVRRTVWVRDGGQCAYVARGGRRCTARGFLEYHHRHPHALGGPPTADNIQLLCRAHNALEARADFGTAACPRTGRGKGVGKEAPL